MQSEFELREDDLSASDWRHMYCILLRGVDQALDILPCQTRPDYSAHRALQSALEDAEEYYLSVGERKN